jgi:hypothetical protein
MTDDCTALNHALCPNPEHEEEQQDTSADTSPTAQDAGNEVNSEPQRHHNQPVYDQCWPPISQPERLLPPAASAYNDQYQSHVGGVRISCYHELVLEYYKGGESEGGTILKKVQGRSGIAHFALTVGSVIRWLLNAREGIAANIVKAFDEDGTPK